MHVFWNTVHNDPSRSSQVVDFGTNRKRICNCQLVINIVIFSNFGTIFPRFRDTSNVPTPRAGTFTPARRPGHYRGCSVLRYLRPRNLAASFAAATGTAGVMAAACCGCARSANQCLRWWPTDTICIILRLQVSWEERSHPHSTQILGVFPLD